MSLTNAIIIIGIIIWVVNKYNKSKQDDFNLNENKLDQLPNIETDSSNTKTDTKELETTPITYTEQTDIEIKDDKPEKINPAPVKIELAHFKVAGVTYHDLKKMIKFAKDNMLYDPYDGFSTQDIKEDPLEKYYEINIDDQFENINFVKEPTNKHDSNAIKVYVSLSGNEYMIGYVPEYINKKVARIIDQYNSELCITGKLTGGKFKEAEYVDDDYDYLFTDKGPKTKIKTYKYEYGFNIQIYMFNDDTQKAHVGLKG